jgi:amino acid adenylation domain-containing protein
VVELQELPVAEREAEGRRLVDAETQRLFDLAHGPLVRATVLYLGAEEHVLLVVVHHIVFDAWSAAVFVRELTTLYEACTTGKPATLPQQPIQYVDFAVWQRQWLQGKALDTQLAYWKQRLHNAPPILELPTEWPRSTSQPFHGAQQSIMLSQPLSRAVKALSQRTGSTLFMTLLTAFKVLLQRYTGQDDIVVGTPIANRPRTEIEGLIGCFINTLVLRTDLAGNPAFLELLRQVRQMALEAYAHQDLPFEKLVEALQPERDLSRTPLFQVLFNMVNIEAQEPRLSDLQMESLAVEEPAAKFDLTLYVRERHETLHLECVYNAALFRQERIREMLAQYQHLLAQAVVHPEHRIGRYSLVTPAAQQVLPAPGEPLAEPSQDLVASLFTQWAQRVPERMALSQGQHTWTYGALAARADELARTLVAHGIARGDVVAVTGERSFGLIASVLGVLLSGGVLLPLDPHLPEPRQQLMLREAAATTLIYVGQSDQGETLCAPQLALDLLRVDAATGYPVNAELAVDPATISLPAITPDEAAYIFFTSGTTGVPKGVLGRHKGLSHFLCWQRDTFAVGPQDRVAQLTSLSFDPVLRDIFLPLTSGATLCLPTAPDLLDAEATLRWLEHERISLLHVVPSRAQFWLANIPPDMLLRALRRTFFAGEPLTDTLVRQWRATAPYSAVVNLYGPTETTLAKCFYPVPPEPSPGIQPAGLPLPQTQALVLAEDARLCGIGELGEIVLRTPFRSLGYINAPAEQRKRFVSNPLRDDAQDILYYTGDCGRYRHDGLVEILGRLDEQVKIRGVRVEPGEVTATLAQHPAVQACVVVPWTEAHGQLALVAYVVAAEPERVTPAVLRMYLSQHLPAAMVPAAFIYLTTLPLTPNGKVDRRALPAPQLYGSEPERAGVAPRTPVEKIVAGIWTDILHLEHVNLHDDFFALGGHSLLATQFISRLRLALQVDLPVRVLFEAPTVAELAVAIVQYQTAQWPQDEIAHLLAAVEEISEADH